MNRLIATLFFVGASAFSAPEHTYIILFQKPATPVTSLDHGALQSHLQTSNQKNLKLLEGWLGSRNIPPEMKDLWLIQGALATLDATTAEKLTKETWVRRVMRSQLRKFLSPKGTVNVTSVAPTNTDLWGLTRIGMDKVRKVFPSLKGKGVRIGILDSGIQSRHLELKNVSITFRDFVNHIPNAYDDHGHGTHVSGTITGHQVGIATEAQIVFGKIFSAGGSGYDSDILEGMQWMFDPDGNATTDDYPRLVSNSWGADLGDGILDLDEFAPYHDAIRAWIDGGIIPVFAAGNSGGKPNGLPGGFPEVIAVGALDPSGTIAEFSSRGPNLWKQGDLLLSIIKPDITAPGVGITSAFPGNKYATWAGTSMATPHVTGVLALALQLNPKIRLADAKALLIKSCEPKIDFDYGYGILDAYALINLASATGREGSRVIH